MALYATNRFPGDGSTTSYEFNFVGKYIARSHVKVYQEDNATKVRTYVPITDSNFLNDTTLRSLPVTPVGSTLVIYRDTPKPPLVDFVNGSRFTEYNMDLVARQGLFVAMEALDAGDADAREQLLAAIAVVTGLVEDATAAVSDATAAALAAATSAASAAASLAELKQQAPLVAFIGDSMAAQQPLLGDSWPALWAERMSAAGAPVTLRNYSISGHSFYRANTQADFGTKTMLQQVIDAAPDVVFVGLGANDALLKVDGRTNAQIQADAVALLVALRAALPSAVIVYVSELLYDSSSFTPSTLKNKGVIPNKMTRASTGILAGLASPEILDDACSTTTRTDYADWVALDTVIKARPEINGWFTADAWKVIRLGAVGLDGVHMSHAGAAFLAGYALMYARTNAALKAKWPWITENSYSLWTDPDLVFSGLLTRSGDGWTYTSGDPIAQDFIATFWKDGRAFDPVNWWCPSGARVITTARTYSYDADVVGSWAIVGARPFVPTYVSINGSDWQSTGRSTDSKGYITEASNGLALPVGTSVVRYRAGSESYDPVTFTVTAASAQKLRPDIDQLPVAASLDDSTVLPTKQGTTARKFTLAALRSWLASRAWTWGGEHTFSSAAATVLAGAQIGTSGPNIRTLQVNATLPAAGGVVQVASGVPVQANVISLTGVAEIGIDVHVASGYSDLGGDYLFGLSLLAGNLVLRTGASATSLEGKSVKVFIVYTF